MPYVEEASETLTQIVFSLAHIDAELFVVGDGQLQMLLMGGLRGFEVLLRWPEDAVE